ncbi:MAG: glycoside hydrolase family 16 protein [Flavobacteriales bacterium]
MRYLTIIMFLAFILSSCEQTPYEDLDYVMLWSDEFNQAQIDTSNWNFESGTGCQYGLNGWGNGEAQYYTSDNASLVNNDFLKIESRKELYSFTDCDGNSSASEYTSARLNSKYNFDFKYGRVEASIKMDVTNGLWHAFWMLPTYPTSSWPLSGEIDIMEQYRVNGINKLITTVHFGYGMIGEDYDSLTTNFFNDFHTYAVEWDRVSIKWYIDDVQVFQVNKTQNQDLETNWPFNEPFHLILNTAVGGTLGGTPDFDENQEMLIDYVRVYQKTIL